MINKYHQNTGPSWKSIWPGYRYLFSIQRLRWIAQAGVVVVTLLLFVADLSTADTAEASDQAGVRTRKKVETVIDLQRFREEYSVDIELTDNDRGKVTLINLNPKVNRWYVLRLSRPEVKTVTEFHLENPYPEQQWLNLDKTAPDALVLIRNGEVVLCPPWNLFGGKDSVFQAAKKSRQVFSPVCDGNLYLRNPTRGHRTAIESVTEFLRDRMPGGEAVVGFVKKALLKDAHRENARTEEASDSSATDPMPGFPVPAAVDQAYIDKLIVPAGLGIEVKKKSPGLLAGRWYAVKNNPGIFISLIQPKAVSNDILHSYPKLARKLDRVESGALVYLVAYDLEHFDLGFAVGTDHPRVGWSSRAIAKVRVPGTPGPDGIGTISPLVANGMLNPITAVRTVSTFTGGFKRSHGAFKYGKLAHRNKGSHYGFVQNGVVLSTLQPELATLMIGRGGEVEMKTWSSEDEDRTGQILHARQNGVPIVEWDADGRQSKPGSLVSRWGPGNWSGSVNSKLRTLRAGMALQQAGNKRFLIYGYFSTATPSAMARVFQAYKCLYAMHLDMNALEHTYLALYHKESQHLQVQHLIRGMSVLDKTKKQLYIPRFLGYADNRDFFYVMKRTSVGENVKN